MARIMVQGFKSYITEAGAGFSRILQHIEERNCAIMSAFRHGFSTRQNRERNGQLEAYIRANFGGPIKLKGRYEEEVLVDGKKEKKEVSEESYFIMDNDNIGYDAFTELVTEIGRHFEQDSIVVIPQAVESYEAVLIPTRDDLEWLPANTVIELGSLTLQVTPKELAKPDDVEYGYYDKGFSQVQSRRFVFKKVEYDEPAMAIAAEAYIRPTSSSNWYFKRHLEDTHKKILKRALTNSRKMLSR